MLQSNTSTTNGRCSIAGKFTVSMLIICAMAWYMQDHMSGNPAAETSKWRKRATSWTTNALDKLTIAEGELQATSVVKFKEKATSTITAAVGEWVLNMAEQLKFDSGKGKYYLQDTIAVKTSGKNVTFEQDITKAIDAADLDKMQEALLRRMQACGATIGKVSSIIADADSKVEAYNHIIDVLQIFTKHLYDATQGVLASHWLIAAGEYAMRQRTNPFGGILVWRMLQDQYTGRGGSVMIRDNASAKLKAAVAMELKRARDVSGYIDYVGQLINEYQLCGGSQEVIDDNIGTLLEKLHGVESMRTLPDADAWATISAASDGIRAKRNKGITKDWNEVRDTIITAYNSTFHGSTEYMKAIQATGPGGKNVQFPLGVALGAITEEEIEKGTYDSQASEIMMAAVAESAPATMEDYRKLMEHKVKLPGDRLQAKLAARSSARQHPAVGQRNKPSPEQGTKKRPPKDKWTCGKCGAKNYYYRWPDETNFDKNTRCWKTDCRYPKGDTPKADTTKPAAKDSKTVPEPQIVAAAVTPAAGSQPSLTADAVREILRSELKSTRGTGQNPDFANAVFSSGDDLGLRAAGLLAIDDADEHEHFKPAAEIIEEEPHRPRRQISISFWIMLTASIAGAIGFYSRTFVSEMQDTAQGVTGYLAAGLSAAGRTATHVCVSGAARVPPFSNIFIALLIVLLIVAPGAGMKTPPHTADLLPHEHTRTGLVSTVWDTVALSANETATYAFGNLSSMLFLTYAWCTGAMHRHETYCFAAASGLGEGLMFADSGCSHTTVKSTQYLSNIRRMNSSRIVQGLTGPQHIDYQADMTLPLVDDRGQVREIHIPGVYYNPQGKYDLISVCELAAAGYVTTMDASGGCLNRGKVRIPLHLYHNVYTLPVAEKSSATPELAMGGISNMLEIEKMHLYLNHCVNYKKLAHMSKSSYPGMRAGLRERDIKCRICQHANITRSPAPPAARGNDAHDISLDLMDMSSIPTPSGKRYVTLILERKTRYLWTYLHDKKTDIPNILRQVLPQLTEPAKSIKFDCAKEYDTPQARAILEQFNITDIRHSDEHTQAQNGMVEKMVDVIGRRARACIEQSQMPVEWWGAAVLLATDIYNCTPHSSLDMDSPFFRRKGVLPDISFFRPFGCAMVVHRGKDLVQHRKLAPRGVKCVYVGTGMHFGRRAYLGFCADDNRVYASIDCQFDATFFPYRTHDQRVYGYYDQVPCTAELSNYYNLPNATIEQIREHINSMQVPSTTDWNVRDIMDVPAHLTPTTMAEALATSDPYGLDNDAHNTPAAGNDVQGMEEQATHRTAGNADQGSAGKEREEYDASRDPPIHTTALENAKKSVFKHGPPEPYASMPQTWRKNGEMTLAKISNAKLGEYLLGIEAEIPCPLSFWPEDGVRWTVRVIDHEVSKRHQGGHKYKCELLRSQPQYVPKEGEGNTWVTELSARQIRTAIQEEFGAELTLQQIFDKEARNSAQHVMAALGWMMKSVSEHIFSQSIKRQERPQASSSACTAMEMALMACQQVDEGDGAYAGVLPAPRGFYDIAKRPDAEKWWKACDKEIKKCFDMGTWEIVDTKDIPEGCKVMDCCFSFKNKTDSQGNLTECRARCNADGRQQEPGSYGDTFAPTAKFSNIRTLCALAAQEGLTLYQFDIKGAFLMAPCKDPVYLNLPGRFKLPAGKALKCRRLIYGLKQSAHGWNTTICNWFREHGFHNVDGDGVTFIKEKSNEDGTKSKIMLALWVDDAICATNDEVMYKQFLDELKEVFDLSDSGKLEWFLGCRVEQDLERGSVRLVQDKYCSDVLQRFQMSDCNPVSTPCEAGQHLSSSDSPPVGSRDPEVIRNYQQCVGACLFLSTFTRPDIAFAVNQCARFMSNPGPTHIAAVKRVCRYLAGTRDRGITYRRQRIGANTLYATADADHAGADDRRSVSGWAVLLAGAAVTWASKRQPVTAISSTESEFYSVSLCALDCVYLRRILSILGYTQMEPTKIAQDNNACIYLVKGAGMYNRAKHIDTRVYRVRELASGDNPEVRLFKISGDQQPSDVLTKGLPRIAFERHRSTLMGE